jgi:hypothetical protein
VASPRNEAHNEHLKRKLSRHISATQIDRDSARATNGTAPEAVQLPADLTALAAIWPKMPDHIRAAIMALAGTVKP